MSAQRSTFSTAILGADHQGAALKNELARVLRRRGLVVVDCTPEPRPGDDYPRAAQAVALRLRGSQRRTGVLVCGSGNGMVMAANRYRFIRAALAPTAAYARKARQDEDANVLVLPAWWVSPAAARRILAVWLATPAATAARHRRRIRELTRI